MISDPQLGGTEENHRRGVFSRSNFSPGLFIFWLITQSEQLQPAHRCPVGLCPTLTAQLQTRSVQSLCSQSHNISACSVSGPSAITTNYVQNSDDNGSDTANGPKTFNSLFLLNPTTNGLFHSRGFHVNMPFSVFDIGKRGKYIMDT